MTRQQRFTTGIAWGLLGAIGTGAASAATEQATRPAGLNVPMEKYASKNAVFLLYKLKGWIVTEGTPPGFQTISVTDPRGTCEAAMFYGASPTGDDVMALAKRFVGGIARQFPDLSLRDVTVSHDRKRLAFGATFAAPQKGPREFRCWLSVARGEFVYSSIEAPQGQLAKQMPLLLSILANVHVFKGAFSRSATAPIQVELAPYRLADGSASFDMPRGWKCQELGAGCFVAGDPTGGYAFTVASVDVITPELNVTVPGVPVYRYMRPSRAMKTLGADSGLATNMEFESIYDRKDVAAAMATVYTGGTVTAEEFIYKCNTKAGPSKGYTFGVSFGARLGTNWSFRHLTVIAPSDKFDAYVGNFIAMLQSYRIDDRWARNYVEQGMARLRWLQKKTADMIAANARDIPAMMKAAYDERQKSMDYIDYVRTSYIRGEQDWISSAEGGTVYRSDSWGTKNLATGDYWEGQPYNYVNFNGRNPQRNEDMTPINSRELWERHIR